MAENTRAGLWRRYRLWIVLVLAGFFWAAGPAGWLFRSVALRAAPRQGRSYRILSLGEAIVQDPATGLVVRVSAPRLRSLLGEALGWRAHLIPPGTIPSWFTLHGEVRMELSDETPKIWVPVVFRIVSDLPRPELQIRLPSDLVNQALAYEGSFAHRERTRRYALGRYTVIHSLRFDTVRLRSSVPERQQDRTVTFRRIEGQATGQVRFRVEENLFDARTTARVRRMELRCDLDFRKYVDGLAMSYRITIPHLDADIRNLARMFERRPVEAIREALEDSLARPRNLERLSRRRLPLYLPLDIELDIEVFPSEEGAIAAVSFPSP